MYSKFNLKSPMPPLWLIYPNISPYSIGWRMGEGERYKYDFIEWFEKLTQEEKEVYKELFPAPILWRDFYKELEKQDNFKKKDNYLFQYKNYQTQFWHESGNPYYSLSDLKQDYKKKKKLKYIFFWGHRPSQDGQITKSCFSQWWISKFSIDTTAYCCMEQYMMAEKARLFQDKEIETKIKNSQSPNQMKILGRKVKNFNEIIWNKVKYTIVLTGNYYKFMQNKSLKTFLLNTNNRILAEASPYDAIWGIKMASNHSNIENPLLWEGQNLLGFALMEVRNEIQKVCKNEDKIDWNKVNSIYN